MTGKELKAKAREKVNGNRGALLISNVIAAAAGAIPLIGVVLSGPVQLGSISMYKDVIDDKKPDYRDLYRKFKTQLGPAFLLQFLLYVSLIPIVLVIILVAALCALVPVIGVIAVLAVIVIGAFFISCYFSASWYVLELEDTIDGDEAIKKGFRIAKENLGAFFNLFVAYIGKILLGIITFGLYMIYVAPEMNLAQYMLLDQIYGKNTSADQTAYEAPQASQPAAGTKICPSCGAAAESDSVFCEKCGTKLG